MTDPQVLRQEILSLVKQYADLVHQPQPFVPDQTPVPPSGKVIGAPELQHIVEASLDGWLTTGRFNTAFEERLARFVGVKHALTVNSGSSANLVAFATLTSPLLGERAIRPGDEVIGVAAGFPPTGNPIIQCGAVPVFVDVEIGTYNIDASQLEAAITPRTKAIMLAHTLGNPFNLEVVQRVCQQHGLWLVEDCCDALGATYQGRKVGTFGDLATLSFYPAHHITMGEGGAVLTSNDDLRRIAESFRDWGRDCWCPPGKDNTCGKRFCWKLGRLPEGYDHKYVYKHLGYNLKPLDPQAAIGRQLFSLELTPQRFIEEIAPARTFGFRDQVEALLQAGLIRGGALDNALVCDGDSWLNPPLRFAEEPVRHKLLDLIGDLALVGLPQAQVFAYRGSHGLHTALAAAIQAGSPDPALSSAPRTPAP